MPPYIEIAQGLSEALKLTQPAVAVRLSESVPVGLELWAGRVPAFETVAVALTPSEQKKVQVLAKDLGVLSEVDQEVQEDKRNRVNSRPMLILLGAKKYTIAAGLNYNLRSFSGWSREVSRSQEVTSCAPAWLSCG
jgi:hypothetical protein